jgi:hypothetical protein
MKYGIIVGGKVTEPTDIPQQGQADPVAWLTRYRFAGDWVPVPDCAVPGTKANGDGTFIDPPVVEAPTAPQSNTAIILERLIALSAEVAAVKEKVDALAVQEEP